MDCPRCATTLHEEVYEGESLDRCGGCGGSWLGRERLGQILELRERRHTPGELEAYRLLREGEPPAADTSAPLSCPICQSMLARSHHHFATEVMIDRCRGGHGFWLDQGELEHIQLAVEEEEDRLTQKVSDAGLSYDDSGSRELLRERSMYKLRFWDWFFRLRGWGAD